MRAQVAGRTGAVDVPLRLKYRGDANSPKMSPNCCTCPWNCQSRSAEDVDNPRPLLNVPGANQLC